MGRWGGGGASPAQREAGEEGPQLPQLQGRVGRRWDWFMPNTGGRKSSAVNSALSRTRSLCSSRARRWAFVGHMEALGRVFPVMGTLSGHAPGHPPVTDGVGWGGHLGPGLLH